MPRPPIAFLGCRRCLVVGNVRSRAVVRTPSLRTSTFGWLSWQHPPGGKDGKAVGETVNWPHPPYPPRAVHSFSTMAGAASLVATTTVPPPTDPPLVAIASQQQPQQQQQQPQHSYDMFCRQCEQTANQVACVTQGVCGKRSETAALQDALLRVVQDVSSAILQIQESANNNHNVKTEQTEASSSSSSIPRLSETLQTDVNQWTVQAVFATATNVNFDDDAIAQHIRDGLRLLEKLTAGQDETTKSSATHLLNPPKPTPDASVEDLEEYGHAVRRRSSSSSSSTAATTMGDNPDATAWREWATYSLKGTCAYAAHCQSVAAELLYSNNDNDNDNDATRIRAKVDAATDEIHRLWALIGGSGGGGKSSRSSEEEFQNSIGMDTILRIGRLNATILDLLDRGHTQLLGVPTPTPVRTTAVEGQCILVSGHDLVDLYHLLQQTKGTGIRVYTHGEMLPAHGYPVLRQFDHLVGNYGTAWQNQKFEFAAFPGPILCTTNCVQEPRRVYKDRLYTINQVGVPGVHHVTNRDFGPVIAHAKRTKGFARTVEPPQFQTTGYHHQSLLSSPQSSATTTSLLADAIVPALQSGDISRVLVIGGCDGSQWDRSYFTNLAEEAPDDTLILTMGCAKNRILQVPKLRHGTLGNTGIPRVLDLGQCNDAHSALLVAQELSRLLHLPPSELPLSVAWSHMEQKAAAVLTTMLALGIPRIRLGPTLPAYWTPQVQREVENMFELRPTGDYENDLAAMMDGK